VAITSRGNLGFSLLELAIVLVVVGIISVSVFSRFQGEEPYALQIAQQNLINSLHLAQQLALAGRRVRFRITGTDSIWVELDGDGDPSTDDFLPLDRASFNELFVQDYPLVLGTQATSINLTPSPITLRYNALGQVVGQTTDLDIVLTAASGAVTVKLSPSGFAR